MSDPNLPRPHLSKRTRLVFATLTAFLVALVAEVVCWMALSVTHGRLIGWKGLDGYRNAVASRVEINHTEQTELEGGDQVPPWAMGIREESFLHPYLGFVARTPAGLAQSAPRYRLEAGNFGFPYNFHEIFNEPSDNVVIVAVVGGSVAQQIGGQGRPFQYLDTQLEALPRFRGKDVRVLNLALGGYKQPQQLFVLTYFLALGAHFDLVINLDGFNDVTLPIRDNLEVGVNPFYPRAWKYRLSGNRTEILNARGAVVVIDDFRKRLARKASKAPWRWSFTASMAWLFVDGRLNIEANRHQIAVMSPDFDEIDPERSGPTLSFDTKDEILDALAATWWRCSQDIYGLSTVHGFEYYHFLQPNQYDVGSKPLTVAEERLAFDPDSDFVDLVGQGYPRLRQEVASLGDTGVVFVDLSRIFEEVDETVYVDTCCHFNTRGVTELVARIAETIGASPGVSAVGIPKAAADRARSQDPPSTDD